MKAIPEAKVKKILASKSIFSRDGVFRRFAGLAPNREVQLAGRA
jgi:hypothetical protein